MYFLYKKIKDEMMNSVSMLNIFLRQCWISLPSLPFPLFPDPGERWRTSSEEAGSRLFWVSTCDVSQTPVWRHYHGLWWFFFPADCTLGYPTPAKAVTNEGERSSSTEIYALYEKNASYFCKSFDVFPLGNKFIYHLIMVFFEK